MPLSAPINFPRWLSENADKLKPPVGNFCLWNSSNFVVMAIGGPNARTDFHVNPTEEWFYQHKGDMVLRVLDDGVFRDIDIREGDMFLLPPNVPHNPIRFENTVGVVMEVQRPEGKLDSMRWYCENEECRKNLTIVYEESFYCTNLGVQLKPVIEKFYASTDLRTCKVCGHVNSAR
ncbi:3-hydroxyanthranilic acid dioxygenase [Polychytrium aggregatum]|uniref:3-hydroxyanthranilic acid dioxygenase n=1 Tax=Polychytrium aggregatum TaxID=110093 RepID=UPI0022FED346|nr:3-hydroxyanthranilic acid dioxygenase [Polychytrium aggregatum]KAI9206458.1 3-hydroxyanthranilic acid dioxygenase [Polychytrium aggregatum]